MHFKRKYLKIKKIKEIPFRRPKIAQIWPKKAQISPKKADLPLFLVILGHIEG